MPQRALVRGTGKPRGAMGRGRPLSRWRNGRRLLGWRARPSACTCLKPHGTDAPPRSGVRQEASGPSIAGAQDKLITTVHGNAKKRRDELLRASEEAKRRAVEVVEVMGELVLDRSIPDAQLRNEILWRIPDEEMVTLVDGCRQLRNGDDGSHLGLTAPLVQLYAGVLASAAGQDPVSLRRTIGTGASGPVPARGQPRAPAKARR